MKSFKNLDKRTKEIIGIVVGNALCIIVLVCALFALNFVMTNEEINVAYFKNCIFWMFFCMSLIRLPMILMAKGTSLITFIRNIVVASIFLVFAIISIFLNVSLIEYCIFGGVFSLIIIGNRILKIIENKHSVRNIVTNSLLITIAFILSLMFFFGATSDMEATPYISILLFVIISITLGDILFFCFSRMKLKAMYRIIKKTFAIEILYGLFVLIIASSFILYIMEESIPTFGDALWYCFAIVTTIGFGDVVAKTEVGRLLSVLLGIYGLIVVAVLTSIIVNFYNETTQKEKEEQEKQEKEQQEVVEKDNSEEQ